MSITTAKDKLATLVDELTKTLAGAHAVTLTQAQITDLKRVTANWLDATQTKVVSLSANKPDYNQLLLQFQNMLEHDDAWRDTITAGGGQAILRFVSAATAYMVYAQERSTQERYQNLARLPSSIYASARSQGVRITRRRPASVPVGLTRQGSEYLIIPPFTAIIVGTTKFFNRKPIVFGLGDVFEVEATLYQGEVFLDTYNSPGQPFAMYEVGNGDGTVSDEDVYLYVNNEEYARVTDGFFMQGPNAKVFNEATLFNGNVEVLTGSGNYGVMPTSNATIQIRYASTLGTVAHTTAVEQIVTIPDFSNVGGKSLGPVSGGAEPRSTEFYRINSPYIRSRQQRSVLRRDYVESALAYDGATILDARFIGQQEIAPTKKWAQGLLKACILTAEPMDDAGWTKFAAYLTASGIEGFTILREPAVARDVDINITLGINSRYGLESAKLAAKSALNTAYAPNQGALGNDFFKFDIQTILKESQDPALVGAINWYSVTSPTDDQIKLAWNEFVRIRVLEVTPKYSTRGYSNHVDLDATV